MTHNAVAKYFQTMGDRIQMLADCAADNIELAAQMCATALLQQRALYIYDTRRMLHREAANRSGGLVGLLPITTDAGSLDDHRHFGPGDLVIVCSVSGVSQRALGMATLAKHRGSSVVAITSRDFSAALLPEHESGLRLHDVADITIDNLAPVGDALVGLDGFDRQVGAFSGVAGGLILGALATQTTQIILDHGHQPSVYTSIHLPGGRQAVQGSEERYQRRGY